MGFFKKLKERIFNKKQKDDVNDNEITINRVESVEKKKKEIKKDEISKEEKSLLKQKQKIAKKEAKLHQKQLSKENKINKYVAGLNKSSTNLTQKIVELQTNHNSIDEDFFEELEEILIMSDISVSMVYLIIDEKLLKLKTLLTNH